MLFAARPNDTKTRKIDASTHYILQRHLPPTVKQRYDAGNDLNIILSAQVYIDPYTYDVQTGIHPGTRQPRVLEVRRHWYWHSSFGKGVIPASGLILQPNVSEREFMRAAPTLDELNPCSIHRYYVDLCKVAHAHGIYVPPYEQYRPQRTFTTVVCADDDRADLPPFFASDVTAWATILHNLMKRDKSIPTTHPNYHEIRYNTNGYEALVTLVSPYHPAYTDNNVLLMPHPTQGKRSLETHFRQAEFYYRIQHAYVGTLHDWGNAFYLIRFINSCNFADYLRTIFQQERHVPECQYKFNRERIVSTLREYLNSPQFKLLGGQRHAGTAVVTPVVPHTTGRTSRYRFMQSSNGGSATRRSGDNSGTRTPRSGDRQVRALDLLDADQSQDDGDETADSDVETLHVHALSGGCLACTGHHDPYCCPLIKGGVEEQKKVFANLSARRKAVQIRAISADGPQEGDLLSFGSNSDQDFPLGEQ
jgi:hypothetical protein